MATIAAAQDTTGAGAVAGVVRSAQGTPEIAVTVCLVGTTRCALTDALGRFRIADVRAARYELEIAPPGQPRRTGFAVDVRAGLDTVLEIVLPTPAALQQTVTVTAPAFIAAEEVKTSGFLIAPAEIRASAGALQDVSRYVQALPGVVIGANDFRNDIIVRGGSPLENLFVVDNVEIPNINAFANFTSAGGTVSLIDAGLLQDVTFLTGGYPAPFTNRVSSVMQITLREGDRQAFRGFATLGFAGAGTILEGPIDGGRGSWVVSFRRSFLDVFTDDIGIGGVPVLYTFNAKAVYDVGPTDRIWLVNVSGVDRIRLGLTPETDLSEELADFDIRYQGRRSATGVNWQRLFGARGVGLLGLTHSRASVESTVKDLVRDGVPPPDLPVDEVIANGPLVFREGSTETETTVKYDLTANVEGLGKLQVGTSAKVFGLDYDSGAPVGNDSPYSIEPGVNPFEVKRSFTAYQTAGYAQLSRDLTRRLSLTAGVRVDDYRVLDETRVSPRAGVSFRLTDHWSVRASYGRYFQQPYFLFVTAFPEGAQLDPLQADHVVVGLTSERGDTRMAIEAYAKRYEDYPVSTQFPSLSLANVGDTFNVREVLFPMVSAGRGRVEGIEFLVENKADGRWFGQMNVSASRARHAGLDDVLRPGAYDYPFVANLDGGYRLTDRWTISARLAWLGGRPFTPFDEATSAGAGRGLFDLARVNAERVPDYFRIDLRAERRFGAPARPFVLFLGVQNVTNRRNVSGYTWNRRLNRVTVQEQMGAFPIAGFEYRF